MAGSSPGAASQEEARQAVHDNDVAIVGMACVMPGAPNLQAYWENIVSKVSAIGDPPPDWGAELCFDPDVEANDRIYCARGGYLGPLAEFDPIKYGVMPNSVNGGEPDHFLALRAAHEALEDAGYDKRDLPRDSVEVIIGRGSYVNRGNTTAIQHGIVVDHLLGVLRQLHPEHGEEDLIKVRAALKASLAPFDAETAPALVPNLISGRIANRLDFMGPNFIVDAACASSLVAVDLGMRDLVSGRCDIAVVGGVHASTPPIMVMIFCQLNAIARSGEIRPFDSRADGTLPGEGVGMVVLKRRRDAEAAGERIYAVIKGVGIASDGRALGLLAPRLEGEELAIRRAYDASGVDPATIELIEAHGTATVVGDATEVAALKRVFGETSDGPPRVALGAVKSMISHLMPASGIAGLIKVTLALYHKVLPPTISCEQPNPKLKLEESPFYLNTETRPWIHHSTETPRRAGVNAFGFGGINAHAILEEFTGAEMQSLARRRESEVVVLSAESRQALAAQAEQVRRRLEGRSDVALADLAFTLNLREHGPARLAIVATTVEDLAGKLTRAIQKLKDERCTGIRELAGIYFTERPLAHEGTLAFVFPGEGSQYPNMLADLCMDFPEVRRFFDLMDRAFTGHERGYLPSQVIFPPGGSSADEDLIWRMDAGAEAVFAANQALAGLLASLGIRPDAVLGHSTGEHSALLVSGAVQVADDKELISHIHEVNAVYTRLEARGEIPTAVLIAVGGADPAFVRALVERSGGELFIAMDNCPHQVVVCGSEGAIDKAVKAFQEKRAICQKLPFGRAYHTPQFEFFCRPLREYFAKMRVQSPRIPLYSCVTASPFPDEPEAIRDLASQQWGKPVRFRETIEAMHADGVRVFVEVGPRGNLTGFINDTLRSKRFLAVSSNVQQQAGIRQLNHLVAQLIVHGLPMRLDGLYARRGLKEIDLNVESPARDNRTIPIRTALQRMRLPEGFALDSGSATRGVRSSGHVHTEPVKGPAAGTAVVHSPAPGRASLTAAPPATAAGIAPSPAAPAARSAGDRVVQGYLQTMERFLTQQRQLMQTYLQRGRRHVAAGSATPQGSVGIQPTASPAIAHLSSSPAPPPAAPVGTRPFIDDITDFSPGRRLTATRRLSLERDHFLLDHTLGRSISTDDPELRALPVVPLTVTMEMLAEAGSLLQPGGVLVAMRDVRAYRWITVEAPVTLQFAAQVRSESRDEVAVVVRELRQDEKPAPVLVEAIVVFADRYPEAPSAQAWPLRDERPSGWARDDLYRGGMFHGPRFQAVVSMDRTGDDGTAATLRTLPRNELVHGSTEPAFVTDPVLLDAAGQVVAFWGLETLAADVDILPYRLDDLTLYASPLAVGERAACRVRAELTRDLRMRSDIEIADARGKVWCRFTGWEDRRFDLPRALIELRNAPCTAFLATRWDKLIQGLVSSGEATCMMIEGYDEKLLEAHGGIWGKMLAHLVLGRRERELWRGLQAASPKRRQDWLLGRCVAKDAVRRLVADTTGASLCPADVEILPDAQGRPEVHGGWKARLAISPVVSLAHSRGRGVALAAASPELLVGIDIEGARDISDGVASLAFSGEELELLVSLDHQVQHEWRMRLWCAREAACKAAGRWGESWLRGFTVTDANVDTGDVAIQPGPAIRAALPRLDGESIRVRTLRDGDFFASAILHQTGAIR